MGCIVHGYDADYAIDCDCIGIDGNERYILQKEGTEIAVFKQSYVNAIVFDNYGGIINERIKTKDN